MLLQLLLQEEAQDDAIGSDLFDERRAKMHKVQIRNAKLFHEFRIDKVTDNAGDGGYLGPYYGGQNYDGEFLAASFDGVKLSIVVVTGQRPDNGFSRFAPFIQ